MTVAAVMLAKDEADVIGYVVEYLRGEVDEILVVDNGSTDGTRELLADLGVLVGDESGYRYSEIVSGLARRAAERGHAWAIPCDGDEAWVAPTGERLGDWLDSLPADVGFATGAHLNHVETSADPDEANPLRRLGWRSTEPGWAKVAVRATADVVVSWGAHAASGGFGAAVGGIAVHHFQWRSVEQAVAKIRRGIAAHEGLAANDNDEHWTRWRGRDDDEIAAWYAAECRVDEPGRDSSLIFEPVLS